MADTVNIPGTQTDETVWIEIIRHMESIYAQLADSQQEIETRARELSEAKELADNIIRSMNDALIALDSAGRINLVNDAVEELFGFSEGELMGQALTRLLPESAHEQWEWRRLCRLIRREEGLREVETTWQSRHGEKILVGVSGSALRGHWGEIVGAVLVVRDMREAKRCIEEARAATNAARAKTRELQEANAELKRLQAELVQAAKMSSLGRLAAGVAHELNNPLGGILLYTDLLLEDIPQDDPRRANVEKIAEQTSRCRQTVRGLLDFGRPAKSTARPVDVNAVLRSALSVLEGQEMFHNIELQWALAEPLPHLMGDPVQLQQAFTNIVLNAVDSITGSGRLTVRTSPAEDGKGVVVSITDTGCGIPEEHREHLFEPFFTMKEHGTGLGLSITYGIVERHNGGIEVVSEVGKGTTFLVTLRSMKGSGADV